MLAFTFPHGCLEVGGAPSPPGMEQDSVTQTFISFLHHRSLILFNSLLVLFLGIWFQACMCQRSFSEKVKMLSLVKFYLSMNSTSGNKHTPAALSSSVNNQRLFLIGPPLPENSDQATPYWCTFLSHFWHGLYLACHFFSAPHVLTLLSCLCFLHSCSVNSQTRPAAPCSAPWNCFAPSCIFCPSALEMWQNTLIIW